MRRGRRAMSPWPAHLYFGCATKAGGLIVQGLEKSKRLHPRCMDVVCMRR